MRQLNPNRKTCRGIQKATARSSLVAPRAKERPCLVTAAAHVTAGVQVQSLAQELECAKIKQITTTTIKKKKKKKKKKRKETAKEVEGGFREELIIRASDHPSQNDYSKGTGWEGDGKPSAW